MWNVTTLCDWIVFADLGISRHIRPETGLCSCSVAHMLLPSLGGRAGRIAQAEGVEPGNPLAPGFYALGQHDSLVAASASLRPDDALLLFLTTCTSNRHPQVGPQGRTRRRGRSKPGQDASLQRGRQRRTTRHRRLGPGHVVWQPARSAARRRRSGRTGRAHWSPRLLSSPRR